MKEHSLEIGFTQKDSNYIHQADNFRIEFDRLLTEAVSLSNGVVSSNVFSSISNKKRWKMAYVSIGGKKS